jgi:predicted DNA binding protein
VLSVDANARTVYTFREARTGCFSIPCLTCKHVTKGILTESGRRENTEEWRLLLRDDSGVAEFYDDLESNLRTGLSVEFAQLSEPSYWSDRAVTVGELSYEQRTAVEAAVGHGYYETPREISLDDLATELDLPRSTLQYRLQQAEGWIIRQFVRNSSLGDVPLALAERDSRTISA